MAATAPSEPASEAPSTAPSNRGIVPAVLRARTFEALQYPNFRLLWIGQGCISLSTWMDQVARGWLLYDLTGSPFQLGLVRSMEAIPLLFVSPIAGTMADRYDRKLQMTIAQTFDALLFAWLAIMILSGQVQPWHVYVTALGGAVVQAFQHPSRQAMISDVVPPGAMTNAIGLGSVLFNVSRMIGPTIAGLLIVFVGTAGSYVTQAALQLLATVLTVRLPADLRFAVGATSHHRAQSFGRSTLDGWRASWHNEPVRAGLVIVTLASLFIVPFTTLLPVFARDLLSVGASGQGIMLSAMGIGALGSAVIISSFGDQLPRGLVMLGGVALYGCAVALLAASPWFPLSVGLMVFVGLFHVTSHALVQTVVQTYADPEVRGRTMGTFQQTRLGLTIGAMCLGGLASLLDPRWAMALMAAGGSLAMVIIFLAMPIARRIR